MSGAAGLSAARRRRAGGSSTSQNNTTTTSNSSNNVSGVRVSVQAVLENHELRLREIEPRLLAVINGEVNVGSGEATIDTGVLDTIAENKTSVDSLVETVNSLKASLADVQLTVLRLTNKVAALSTTTDISVADVSSEIVEDSKSVEEETNQTNDV